MKNHVPAAYPPPFNQKEIVMERSIHSTTNLGLAIIIGVCLCSKTAYSINTQNGASADRANPVTSQAPSPPLPNDCRSPKDDIERNANFIDDSANYAIYAILSSNAYKREK